MQTAEDKEDPDISSISDASNTMGDWTPVTDVLETIDENDLNGAEERLYNLCKILSQNVGIDVKITAVRDAARAIAAAKLTNWNVVNKMDKIQKLRALGYSEEEAKLMVEEQRGRRRNPSQPTGTSTKTKK